MLSEVGRPIVSIPQVEILQTISKKLSEMSKNIQAKDPEVSLKGSF